MRNTHYDRPTRFPVDMRAKLTTELGEKLTSLAQQRGVSTATIVREALWAYEALSPSLTVECSPTDFTDLHKLNFARKPEHHKIEKV